MPACCFIRSMREHGPLIWLPTRGRHRDPAAVRACEILDRRIDRAVLLDQLGHDVVDRLEALGVRRRLPGREGEDVVAGSRLRFGGDGQQVLVALRGDVVDRDLDLLLLGPFVAQRGRRVVGAGHPVVPEADRQLAGGVGAAHMRHRDRRRGGCCRQETTTRHPALEHDAILHGFPARTPPVLCSLSSAERWRVVRDRRSLDRNDRLVRRDCARW